MEVRSDWFVVAVVELGSCGVEEGPKVKGRWHQWTQSLRSCNCFLPVVAEV